MTVVVGFNWPIEHDNTVAAIVDGKLVFASEEERYIRRKHAPGYPPERAFIHMFKHLKNNFGIKPGEVDAFAVNYDPKLYTLSDRFHMTIRPAFYFSEKARLRDPQIIEAKIFRNAVKTFFGSLNFARIFLDYVYNILGESPSKARIIPVRHHLAHAASTYYFSGHNSMVVLTLDGVGETESTCIWRVKSGEFEEIASVPATHYSLGMAYESASEELGFNWLEGPGKVMGLAPYGHKNPKISRLLKDVIVFPENGEEFPYKINTRKSALFSLRGRYFYEYYSDLFKNMRSIDMKWDHRGAVKKNVADFAWWIQNATDKAVIATAELAKEQTGEKNIGLSGGVALNAKANMELHYKRLFDDIFIFPAASDSGTPVGAAAYVYEHVLGHKMVNKRLETIYLGPEYSDESVKKALTTGKWNSEYIGDDVGVVAEMVAKGKIVTWYQGRSELGPRALGNRSIVADPTRKETWKKVNEIKGREWWRPLAPSLLYEELGRYFEEPAHHQFMILMLRLNKFAQKELPAICHVDNTARPQSLKRKDNPNWYDMIKAFKQIKGHGIVVNTSFNLAGEPLIETPQEAIRSFAVGGFDAMYMQGWLIRKNR